MLHLVAIAFASFVFVGLKAFQQLNVFHNEKALVFITSNLMAFAEVYLVVTYVKNGADIPLILTVGISNGCGCLTAMYLRKRFIK
jgi:hypothetical protein